MIKIVDDKKMKLLSFLYVGLVLFHAQEVRAYGVNGGIECAACTIVTGIFGQVAEINNASVSNITLRICDHLLWPSAENVCREAIQTLEPLLYLIVELEGITADTICYGLDICHQDPGEEVCHLFPAPTQNTFKSGIKTVREKVKPLYDKWYGPNHKGTHSLCEIPGLKEFCIYIAKTFSTMAPAFDLDHDKFSSLETWRGSNWRGKDCSDLNPKIYPGHLPHYADVNYDGNCNGIWGLDKETGIPWETKLCGSSKSRGILMFGDSVGAHFHFPLVWFSPKLISKDTFFRNATRVLLDELDWPQYSFSTGFKNVTDPGLIQGQVDSVYLRMRKRNLCNHRDYQNVCRNGATSFDLVNYVGNIARGAEDKPLTILLGVFGNDVCNRFPNTLSNMTSAKQFYKNIKGIIDTLESSLPPESHIILLGLVNGSFIYDTLAERLHPLGEYHGDVKYKDVFKWFECMQITPCRGWLSDQKDLRDATTKRALELTHMMKYIASSYVSKKISVSFVPNPLSEVIQRWTAKGGKIWQLFEAVDGFHPDQIAQPIIADVLWKNIKLTAPESIGPINPFNEEIERIFGDQGGH
ncbi:acyloxyacyl hydrolase-like [Thrips palmi]|uniref:Acyloxyacyl hydrolase-like n=1 Tax=Thrips palmi TaxID=161013 RepID=A0A6P8Z8F2_THRPL|nr:acyloxyacyl hydrolase-like [Thrips palmi]